jgi:hypothetical protein
MMRGWIRRANRRAEDWINNHPRVRMALILLLYAFAAAVVAWWIINAPLTPSPG